MHWKADAFVMPIMGDIGRDEIISGLKRIEPRLRDLGICALSLFGSRARGDHRPDSDLDVLIDVRPDVKFSLLDLIGASHVIGDELHITANIFMKRSLDKDMATTIDPDTIEVFHA